MRKQHTIGLVGATGVVALLAGVMLLGLPSVSDASGDGPSLNIVEAGKRLQCGGRAIAGTIIEDDGQTTSTLSAHDVAKRVGKAALGASSSGFAGETSYQSEEIAEYLLRDTRRDLIGIVIVRKGANGWVPAMATVCGQEVAR